MPMVRQPALAMIYAITLAAPRAGLPQSAAAPAGPGVRNAHAAVYDSRDRTLVLFGGATATAVRADTWRWHDGFWRPEPMAGPGPRTFPAMAYDSARDEVVLFGGNRVLFGDSVTPPVMLGDTWILRNGGWKRVSSSGPAPRAEAAVGYDPRRGRTVLFGGYSRGPDGPVRRLGDSWEWDGARWIQVSATGPSPRSGAAMAYHPGLRAVVLFGGSGGPAGDTWAWDGREWTRLPVPPAPGRFNTVMAWDPGVDRLVRFGGYDGTERASDTWELYRREWVRVPNTGPSPRNHSVLVSAGDRGSVLLYGGHDGETVFGDLWERRNGCWVRIEATAPIRRVLNGH